MQIADLEQGYADYQGEAITRLRKSARLLRDNISQAEKDLFWADNQKNKKNIEKLKTSLQDIERKIGLILPQRQLQVIEFQQLFKLSKS